MLQNQQRLDPRIWAKKMAAMQWQLFKHGTNQLVGFVPEAAQRSVGLIREGKFPTPFDSIEYTIDFWQRWLITLDTLRQRGNQYFEHEAAGLPPVLNFKYRTLIDARKLERPVAYALLEIFPPEGVQIDADKRPFVIVDPRAGHGPGIGGFKEDSEVGEAFRAGHPVYMVSFYPEPVLTQTLGDIAAAEAQFLEAVASRHPNAPKPVVIGNCQGGWAVMGLAAAHPGLTGPIVINGAPLSYWAGARGKNPMRYNGGLFGGSWMCQFGCDLGNGKFDGAHLVSNFENLDLANTFWKKPYNLLSRVDTEAKRFLEFERWWNGHYTLNEAEMRAIVEELFVGNRLASGAIRTTDGTSLNLRNIKVPIVIFASMGDNITPPEQALNWIADVYGETREIVANGQVIVYLKHSAIGHLGIFVSGAVAVREHRQIVNLLQYIEQLVPGLYEMKLRSTGTPDNPSYEIVLENREISDVVGGSREDESEFEIVRNISGINSRAYDAYARPLVRGLSSDTSAKLLRNTHPARLKHYVFSNKNPALRPVEKLSALARDHRQPAASDNPIFAWRKLFSDAMINWLDGARITRDTLAENLFFATYGWMRVLGMGGSYRHPGARPARDEADIQALLARVAEGGVVEAVIRALIIGQRAMGISLPVRVARVNEKLLKEPEFKAVSELELQRLLREQAIIVAYLPERATQALAELLPTDKQRGRVAQIIRELAKAEQLDPRFVTTMSKLAHDLDIAKEEKQNELRPKAESRPSKKKASELRH